MNTERDTFWAGLEAVLAEQGIDGPIGRARPLGGGCIHAATRLEVGERSLFLKHGTEAFAEAFAVEADALAEMAATGTVRVPRPLATGVIEGTAYLVTEYLQLGGDGDARAFGEALARMHGHGAAAFGWHRDNWIGATEQPNGWYEDWIAFWRERRLGYQLDLAEADGHGRLARAGRGLLDELPAFFPGYAPRPALLHGDLWAGNYGFDEAGRGCLFDPATYHGDREADLAMTELFGGFPRDFYAGYEAAWPLDPGYRVRKTLYNLYHVLNHAHLFGGGYAGRAARMIDTLRAEIRG